jgi:hypothetical protein
VIDGRTGGMGHKDIRIPALEEEPMNYETWEQLEDEVEVTTGASDCWCCLIDSAA